MRNQQGRDLPCRPAHIRNHHHPRQWSSNRVGLQDAGAISTRGRDGGLGDSRSGKVGKSAKTKTLTEVSAEVSMELQSSTQKQHAQSDMSMLDPYIHHKHPSI